MSPGFHNQHGLDIDLHQLIYYGEHSNLVEFFAPILSLDSFIVRIFSWCSWLIPSLIFSHLSIELSCVILAFFNHLIFFSSSYTICDIQSLLVSMYLAKPIVVLSVSHSPNFWESKKNLRLILGVVFTEYQLFSYISIHFPYIKVRPVHYIKSVSYIWCGQRLLISSYNLILSLAQQATLITTFSDFFFFHTYMFNPSHFLDS